MLNGTSILLSFPMKSVEIVANGLFLRPLSRLIDLPVILNGTGKIVYGKGLRLKEYTKIGIDFNRITNSTLFKKARKIVKILRSKDFEWTINED